MAKRRPKAATDPTVIPPPTAFPVLIQGEHFFPVDARFDEAVKRAEKIGAQAAQGVWVSALAVEKAGKSAKAAVRLAREMDKALTELE